MYVSDPTLTRRGEQFYKKLIALRPDGPESYFILADFYASTNRFADAVAAYKEALQHSQVGSGRMARKLDKRVA